MDENFALFYENYLNLFIQKNKNVVMFFRHNTMRLYFQVQYSKPNPLSIM